jgi:hypothetical protein
MGNMGASETCERIAVAPPARPHPLVGEWTIARPASIRAENGSMTQIQTTGTLTVPATGDSLIGLLEVEPVSGEPARPVQSLVGVRAT